VAAFELDLGDDSVGPASGFLESGTMGHHAEDAAARGDHPAVWQALGASMDDVHALG
jgi:hypothetical protein